jgi:hypothetical protein
MLNVDVPVAGTLHLVVVITSVLVISNILRHIYPMCARVADCTGACMPRDSAQASAEHSTFTCWWVYAIKMR